MQRLHCGFTLSMALGLSASAISAQPSLNRPWLAQLAGCYALTRGNWSGPLPATGIPAAHTPPAQFRLDTLVAAKSGGHGFVVEPTKLVEGSRMAASWTAVGADSVLIVWSTGFVGVALRLSIRGDTLIGRATTFHDAHAFGEPPDPSADVSVVRTACGAR